MAAMTLFQLVASILVSHLILTVSGTSVSNYGHLHSHPRRALSERAPVISTSLTTGWSSFGCWTDDVNSRALYQGGTTNQSMTENACIAYCSNNGFTYAGVEYGTECYCGKVVAVSSKKTLDGDCNMPCAGASSELCGAGNRLNIFHLDSDKVPAAGPATNAGPPDWGFLGCYVDSVASRTLPVNTITDGGSSQLTVALCTKSCGSQGYLFSGVEYSGECFCGNSTIPDSMLAPNGLSGCSMVCNGNSTEFCGGANRIDVYGYGRRSTIAPSWMSAGCYTDTVQSRTLRYAVGVSGGANNMTQLNCQTACFANGYTISGTEYAQECWCDKAYQGNGGPAPDGDAGCNMACKGDGSQFCGGPNRLNVYTYVGGASSSTTTTTAAPTVTPTPTGTVTATTTTTSVSSGATDIPGNWTYRGCYVDNLYGRIIYQQPDSSSLTVGSCIATCQGLGYSISGMEYSTQCFCGSYVMNGGALAQSDSECAMSCGGNSNQVCGGPNRMSLYATGNFSSYGKPKPYNDTLGAWTYRGCLRDTPQPRTLPYQVDMLANLTVPNCLNLCHKYGYGAASMEYGQQCFCGDDTDRINAGAQFLAEETCNTPCPAQPDTLCGGANAMNYYTWDNLNTWNSAVGDAAGQYKFLIGGVVIPLITQVGINGKVSFVEKHGTGPPNSTGAYMLDLSQIDNFDRAWQTMYGLKTDVFCSAGLTLPDKAGRMINVGGWSANSLYGVRFYTPDGSDGVQGTNDWQENVAEVSLQKGRWYPGILQLVNGSILVVGGEDGSNGPPVPNLEVIPRPPNGPVLYMDWLDRTDPYNLYPFLTVLPTGNIAVFYYNEARILDENTFQTVRTLPNIPGAVNNDKGGRTYPLEGTSMLLPQHAPYTDPLEVLICGGSTPFGGNALDNCVSITPEVPGAQWTIERMPSRRVISCMTALPDGTYLILNGAQQGAAGFGLATNPNHNAILYDPSLPRSQRMTRMANTTIDRLYHSEAILLMDGRILVSGSDPEDTRFEQEYRLEVFIPPYLMGNLEASRPNFTIVNNHTDWAYSESIDIIVDAGDVSKISLMASVASTHGNSMGQRTIFPAYSCTTVASNSTSNSTTSSSVPYASNSTTTSTSVSSNSTGTAQRCTIIAPPNGHITGGPGWHMLFVLNSNNTPSIAKWVRIGGDPAGLGNWPNFPDFNLPGV